MILTDLSEYLKQRQRASVADLAVGLDATPDALRAMLGTLERKGRVRRLDAPGCSKGCCKCDPASLELYEWVKPTA